MRAQILLINRSQDGTFFETWYNDSLSFTKITPEIIDELLEKTPKNFKTNSIFLIFCSQVDQNEKLLMVLLFLP